MNLYSAFGYECYADSREEAHKRLSRLLCDIGFYPISINEVEECMANLDFDKIGGRKNPGFLKSTANNILKTTKTDQV
jgi:hypothetical protein